MEALNTLAQNIVTGLRLIGGTIVIGALTWAGILWMTAAGNPRQLETARSALIGALVGFAIVAGAQPLAGIITSALGGG